jgi:hypothetical protein
VHQKKRDEDRPDTNPHESFIADATRMKRKRLRRKFIAKLVDKRPQCRPPLAQAELGNAPLERFLIA